MSAQQAQPNQSPKRPRIGERTMLACTHCKRKKLKCDGGSPKCQNCVKSQGDCLVEDPATGLHRPRDYIRSLEARVAYLEGLLYQLRPEVALDHLGSEGEVVSPKDKDSSATAISVPEYQVLSDAPFAFQFGQTDKVHIGQTPGAVPPPVSEAGYDTQADMLSSEVALLCLSAAGREPHYFGPSSAVSFSRIASATMGLHHKEGTSVNSNARDAEIAGKRQDNDLEAIFPSPTAALRLTQAYWNNIHPQYPFLHRPTFEIWEKKCMEAYAEKSIRSVHGLPLYFVLMVYAIGSLALGQNEVEKAESYYSLALDYLAPVLERDALESIQSILCCAVYSIRSHIGASLWKISGLAMRTCIELGYHRSTERFRSSAGTLTKEISKRCFWVAYDIDRVAAFILGRPVGITDDAIDVELPLDVEDEYITETGLLREPRNAMEAPTTMTGAIHSIKLRKLWSKFSDCLYPSALRTGRSWDESTVRSLRQELEQWRASAPNCLDFPDSSPLSVWASQEWFHVAYCYSVLLLYRHHISGMTTNAQQGWDACNSDQAESIEQALEECLHRSRDMCHMYRRLYQRPTIQFTWGSLHILFLGGLTYVYCLWRSPRLRARVRQADVISTCMACTTVLVIIAERFKLATSYRDLFEVISERTMSMMCGELGNAPSNSRICAPGISNKESNTIQTTEATVMNGENNFMDTDKPESMQDWITALDGIGIPQESEWLVQELLQGVRDFNET